MRVLALAHQDPCAVGTYRSERGQDRTKNDTAGKNIVAHHVYFGTRDVDVRAGGRAHSGQRMGGFGTIEARRLAAFDTDSNRPEKYFTGERLGHPRDSC